MNLLKEVKTIFRIILTIVIIIHTNQYNVILSETLISIINSEKIQLEKSRLILAFSRNLWNILIKN